MLLNTKRIATATIIFKS